MGLLWKDQNVSPSRGFCVHYCISDVWELRATNFDSLIFSHFSSNQIDNWKCFWSQLGMCALVWLLLWIHLPHLFCVCCKFLHRIAECGLLMRCLEELATRYPATKFVKIISTECIPNYPDRNLPTLLVYNNGAVKANYAGLHSFGRRCTPEGTLYIPHWGRLCHSFIIWLQDHLSSYH